MKIEDFGSESGSGSISQRHGSADPDPDPDPHQNVMDLQHWSFPFKDILLYPILYTYIRTFLLVYSKLKIIKIVFLNKIRVASTFSPDPFPILHCVFH
jgi:hypothetical protein